MTLHSAADSAKHEKGECTCCAVELRTILVPTIKEEHERAQESQRHGLQEHMVNIEQLFIRQQEFIQRMFAERCQHAAGPEWQTNTSEYWMQDGLAAMQDGFAAMQDKEEAAMNQSEGKCPQLASDKEQGTSASLMPPGGTSSDQSELLQRILAERFRHAAGTEVEISMSASKMQDKEEVAANHVEGKCPQPAPSMEQINSTSMMPAGGTVNDQRPHIPMMPGMMEEEQAESESTWCMTKVESTLSPLKKFDKVVPSIGPTIGRETCSKSQPGSTRSPAVVGFEEHCAAAPSQLDFAAPCHSLNQVSPKAVKRLQSRGISTAKLGSNDSLECMDSEEDNEEDRLEWDEHIKAMINKQLSGTGGTRYSSATSSGPNDERCIVRFAHSSSFNTYCCFVVLSNSAFIGMDTTLSMGSTLRDSAAPTWTPLVQSIFTLLFAVELIIRLYAFRKWFFLGSEWKWNTFDLMLVVSSLLEEALDSFGSVGFLRVIRGLRMLRVLRLVRVFRVVRELRLMVCSVLQSFTSFVWALLLLFVITYLAAVFFMQAILMSSDLGGQPDDLFQQDVANWYGSLPVAFLSMIMCITGGVNWHEVMRPLSRIHWVNQVVFVFYVLFAVIGVLNVLTGIFVERAQELSGLDRDLVIQGQMKRNEAFLIEMKTIFEEADSDGSQCISWDEFKEYLKNDEVKAYLATQQLDTYDARQLFNILGCSGDQEVAMDDFIKGCMRLRGVAKSVDLVALLQESRKQNRKVRRNMSNMQEQLDSVASLLGSLERNEEGPAMPTRGGAHLAAHRPLAASRQPAFRDSMQFLPYSHKGETAQEIS